jgi:hypothetical protein
MTSDRTATLAPAALSSGLKGFDGINIDERVAGDAGKRKGRPRNGRPCMNSGSGWASDIEPTSGTGHSHHS